MEAVVVEGATKRFGDEVAVRDIDLRVETGTILGVIGPSGSGKTTTVRMLTGALAPTEGQVRVLGEDPLKFRRRTRERIGYMPQQFTLYPDLTARENVDFVASLFGMVLRARHRRTREVLELVDLWDVRSRRAGRMSGGMQRRLELASALVHDPMLLFLDEPTAGIDPLLRGTIWGELQRLREAGRTLVVTTQYVNEAEECDAVALISDGQLIANAPPDELRRQAIGGDVVSIQTQDPFDAGLLRDVPGVTRLEQFSPTEVRATVNDAGTALPDVVEAVTQRGGEVTTATEQRPSFDEVFATLVERHRAEGAAEADADDGSDDQRGPAAGPDRVGAPAAEPDHVGEPAAEPVAVASADRGEADAPLDDTSEPAPPPEAPAPPDEPVDPVQHDSPAPPDRSGESPRSTTEDRA